MPPHAPLPAATPQPRACACVCGSAGAQANQVVLFLARHRVQIFTHRFRVEYSIRRGHARWTRFPHDASMTHRPSLMSCKMHSYIYLAKRNRFQKSFPKRVSVRSPWSDPKIGPLAVRRARNSGTGSVLQLARARLLARCLSSSDKRLRRRPSLCRRAAGTFHVMGLRVSESKED